MGRNRGFVALEVGVRAGAEIILVPEIRFAVDRMCDRLVEGHRKGKKSAIIIMAEGAGNSADITEAIKERTVYETRLTRLGHMQRGGHPTASSRIFACKMGAASVDFLLEGKRRDMIGTQGGRIVSWDLEYASTVEKPIDEQLYKLGL
jgi:6-phosphofructokinase 1